nr:MAG TPA: hypothetical protein [Caudoviricetes sp.]
MIKGDCYRPLILNRNLLYQVINNFLGVIKEN